MECKDVRTQQKNQNKNITKRSKGKMFLGPLDCSCVRYLCSFSHLISHMVGFISKHFAQMLQTTSD